VLVMCASVMLLLLSGFGLARLSFDADVLSLLPRDGEATPAFRTFLQRFGSLDQLFVVFTAPEGRSVADYSDHVDRWVAQLRAAPEIEWVDPGTAGPDRDWAWLADHQLLLLRGTSLDTALARLQPEGMAAALASTRELLTMPSPAVAAMVRQDPLDLLGLLRQQLGGQRAGITAGVTEGGYVTADGRRRLVIAKPRRPPFDTDFSRQLLQRLETIGATTRSAGPEDEEPLPPLEIAFAGGHRIAVETEAIVKRESITNGVGSLALILPLLYVVFRSAWLLVCGALPSLMSLVVALGLMGLGGATLSAAATGASAMLFGLGIDGVVLVYIAHRLALADGLGVTESVAALGGPSSSMLLGMLTTAATFYGLAFVDFPSLQQLGLIIGHSMVACGVLTLVLVPALLPKRRPRGPIRVLTWPTFAAWVTSHRTPVLAVSAAVTVALGAASMRLHVDTSLERMRSTTPGARFEESVRAMFGLPSDVYVWLERGPALEPLLQANEAFAARVRAEAPGLTIDAASVFLPSDLAQAQSAARVRNEAPQPQAIQLSLARAAAEAGFRDGTLDPFLQRLPKLLDRGQRLTFDGYRQHGLGDVVGRFVSRDADGWTLATYAFPKNPAEASALERIAASSRDTGQLTGLALVNRELAARFVPQFLSGLLIGSVVVVLMIALTFRTWRLSLLAIVPTVVGLVWAAGLLALARIPLDLFALFAVVTFVGIGIDYGIHVVHRYRDHGDAELAVAQLAPVIVVAGLITLAGYGTLVTSSYPPLRSIGLVSAVSILTLVAASVLLLPALLPRVGRTGASRRADVRAVAGDTAGGDQKVGTTTPRARAATTMRVHALVPAFNEAETIASVVTGLAPHVAAICVIDDGSTDGTADAARRAGADVIVNPGERGKGAAIRAGLARVLERDCSHVLLIDGDLQHLPGEAPLLIAEAERTGADVVLGERRFDRQSMPASRYHANRIGSLALSRFMGVAVRDTQCGFRLFRADALRRMRLKARGYDIETEMLVKLTRLDGRIARVPITAVYAGQRSKLRPVRDTTKTCFLAVYYRFLERL
jgi:predicted exporter